MMMVIMVMAGMIVIMKMLTRMMIMIMVMAGMIMKKPAIGSNKIMLCGCPLGVL